MFPDLFVGGSIVKMLGELTILGIVLDSNVTFESHVRSVAASASRRIDILRKITIAFRDNSIVFCCFWSFILLVLEYCSSVWMSAAVTYLSLLERVVRSVFRFSDGVFRSDLWHRRRVAAVSLLSHLLFC